MEFIGPAIIVGTIFYGLVSVVQAFSNYFLRKKIVEKENLAEGTIQALRLEGSRHTALKWGMVVLFGGIGLIILSFVPYDYNSPLPYGIEAVMISAGFLVYYFMVKKEAE